MGLANVGKKPRVGRTAVGIMFASFTEAEGAIDRQADIPGIGIFLAVVFPPADRAEPQGIRRFKRLEPATRAAKLSRHQRLHVEIDGLARGGVYALQSSAE
jgi:hypothetical protein